MRLRYLPAVKELQFSSSGFLLSIVRLTLQKQSLANRTDFI